MCMNSFFVPFFYFFILRRCCIFSFSLFSVVERRKQKNHEWFWLCGGCPLFCRLVYSRRVEKKSLLVSCFYQQDRKRKIPLSHLYSSAMKCIRTSFFFFFSPLQHLCFSVACLYLKNIDMCVWAWVPLAAMSHCTSMLLHFWKMRCFCPPCSFVYK